MTATVDSLLRPAGIARERSRLANDDQPASFVYRFYDHDGQLLYIGATDDIRHRMHQHSAVQPWWGRVAKVTADAYPDRVAALLAEAAAIKAERPLMNFAGTDKAKIFGSEVRMLLGDFFAGNPGAREVDAVRALGVERAVVSANTRTLVDVGVLLPGEGRTYTVDDARLNDVVDPLEEASRRAPIAVPTPVSVFAATQAFDSELQVHLSHYFAEHPGRQVDAARALGVERAVVSLNVRALLETGVLVQGPERTYQVDRDRFHELIRAWRTSCPVGEVVDINPAHRLVAQLRRHLEHYGSIQQDLEELRELGVNAAQWRGAARRAARQLQRPVQTGAGSSSVWAALRDWPAAETERTRHQEQLRRAVEAAALLDIDP